MVAVEKHGPSPSAGAGRRAALRVLVVDDDEQITRPFGLLLAHYGFDARVAGTVAEAVRHVEAWRPEAVILDLMLPDGSGVTVLRHMRQHQHAARVAILTAASDPRVMRALEPLRPDAVFAKPTEFLDLKAWLSAGHA